MKFLVVILAALGISACASSPDSIQMSSVSTLQYKDYSCEQIGMELDRVQSRVNQLHGSLKKKSDDDTAQMAVGMVLFWPALFSLKAVMAPRPRNMHA